MKTRLACALLLGALTLAAFAPMTAQAQRRPSSWSIQHREKSKNDWRNIGIASGVLGVIGLLKNDGTLTFLGTSGALYSAYRYEQDRKSSSKLRRARAAYFSRPYFYRDGRKYARRTVHKDGKKYYRFVRVDD